MIISFTVQGYSVIAESSYYDKQIFECRERFLFEYNYSLMPSFPN